MFECGLDLALLCISIKRQVVLDVGGFVFTCNYIIFVIILSDWCHYFHTIIWINGF